MKAERACWIITLVGIVLLAALALWLQADNYQRRIAKVTSDAQERLSIAGIGEMVTAQQIKDYQTEIANLKAFQELMAKRVRMADGWAAEARGDAAKARLDALSRPPQTVVVMSPQQPPPAPVMVVPTVPAFDFNQFQLQQSLDRINQNLEQENIRRAFQQHR